MKSSIGRAIVVGVIYRPPDQDINEFSITMSTILDKLKSEKKGTYLYGDYNINLLNTDKHVPTAEFLDTMFSYFMYPVINRPTRCIKQSATLLDNIYSNIFEHGILTGIFYTDITDHFPIFYIDHIVPIPCEPSFMLTRQCNIKKKWQSSQQN